MSEKAYKLPDNLQVKTQSDCVKVPLNGSAKIQFSAEELSRLTGELQLVRMNSKDAYLLTKIGQQSQALGIMDRIHGEFFMTRAMVLRQMARLEKVIEDSEDPEEQAIAREQLAMFIDKLVKVNTAEVKVDATKATVEIAAESVRVQASWKPGSDILPTLAS